MTGPRANGAQRPPASADAQRRLAAMIAEIVLLQGRTYTDDDLADRALTRNLIRDAHVELEVLERRLRLQPVRFDTDRRPRVRRVQWRGQ